MIPRRNSSTIGTVLGFIVFAVAIIGTTFFGWSWDNPDGLLLPLGIGVIAAAAGLLAVFQKGRD